MRIGFEKKFQQLLNHYFEILLTVITFKNYT